MLVIVLSIFGALMLALLASRFSGRGSQQEITTVKSPPADCCGAHEVCEKESLLTHDTAPVYYNDEELDTFQGVEATAYSNQQIEQFREVLYTMQEEEVPGWLRSLQTRGITPPLIVREEALMIVGELRGSRHLSQ